MDNYKVLVLSKESIEELLGLKVDSIESLITKEKLISCGVKDAIVYNYDSVSIGNIEETILDIENIMEARFFSENIEVVITNENEIKGYIIVEKEDKLIIKENMEIYSEQYSKLEVKKYITLDEDGQGYVKYLKPCRLLK